MIFNDRRDAGRRLAKRLQTLKEKNPVVLALPRGGVPVGLEIARALRAPLDLVLVRKIGAPLEQELAVGVVIDGKDPELVTNARLLAELAVSSEYLEVARMEAVREIERRRLYLGDRPPVDLAGCTAIVTDDGVATGATMLAALRGIQRRNPIRILLAVPVASELALELLHPEVDKTVCLQTPAHFRTVGEFYRTFPQLRDDEVIALLDQARAFAPPTKPRGNDEAP
ncbi:MAG: phosphoribosyltransferase [Rhodopila sp.]